MIENKLYYTYNDVSLVPASISEIEHRKECNPYTAEGTLPIFTAPMSTVVDSDNFSIYEKNGIIPILPRNITLGTRIKFAVRGKWAAFSLKEFEQYFCEELADYGKDKEIKVLIDIANGHISKLYDLVKKSKSIFGDIIKIMIGNIANPETYREVVNCGADYVRAGIGGGRGCITSSNTSIHMPMASLINDIALIKKEISQTANIPYEKLPKIIADGGIRNYNDIIKALALGADYVMVGSVFAKAIESSAIMTAYVKHAFEKGEYVKIVVKPDEISYNHEEKKYYYKNTLIEKLTKQFYGMASAKGQKDLYGKKIKTSEGIEKELDVEYSLSGWSENFIDFLRSAMSYLNAKTLKDIREAKVIILSNNAFNAINR